MKVFITVNAYKVLSRFILSQLSNHTLQNWQKFAESCAIKKFGKKKMKKLRFHFADKKSSLGLGGTELKSKQ